MEVLMLNHDNSYYALQFPKLRELNIIEENLEDFINNKANICFFVEKSKVIGLSWGYVLNRMDSEAMLYIHSVDVLLEHRNKGVGALMIETYLSYQKNII